jgi:hypothetical protein
MSRRKLHIRNCWPRLPHKFPAHPKVEICSENAQLTFTFHDTYRAKRQPTASPPKEAYIRMQKQGRLKYCSEKNSWEIHDAYDRPIPMRCGEYFEIQLGKTYLPCRLELDRGWLVYFIHTRLYLHPKMSYAIRGI